MKKYICLVLSIIMLLTITGCQPSDTQIMQESEPIIQDTSDDKAIVSNNIKEPEQESESSQTSLPENSKFEVHFMDVGQADSALILCDDKAMLIDGGNASDSSLIYTYLKNHNVSQIDYLICSHPHEDHIGGLSAALSNFDVNAVYAPLLKPTVQYIIHLFKRFLRKD